MEKTNLIGSTTKLNNSLLFKRKRKRVEIKQNVEGSVDTLDALLRSDIDINIKLLYSAYCDHATKGTPANTQVNLTVDKYPAIERPAMTKARGTLAVNLKGFSENISKVYFGCTQAEKAYLNEIIRYILTKKPRLISIFDKCLTASDLKLICS